MPPDPASLAGRVDVATITSEALRGNPLGDPHVRPLWVQVPPDDPASPHRRLPVIYLLQGYFGRLEAWDDRVPFRRTVPEAVDALGVPALVVYVDAWTAYGGSQFVDSPGTGNYLTYLADEVVPWVDARYPTLADPAHRAVAGHSSGGFGAMVGALTRPDVFGAFASHAGDALYEYLYVPLFAKAVRVLRAWDGDLDAWWRAFRSRTAFTMDGDGDLALLLGAAAAFTPDADGRPQPPLDLRTGVLDEALWARWLAWDPVRMVAADPATAAGLRAVWLDGGTRDEWNLEIGSSAMAAALLDAGLPASRLRHELFDGGHEQVEYRFADAVGWLADRIG
jgi:hypothetical protein